MGVLIFLCFVAIYVYYRLINLPSISGRVNQPMASFQREQNENIVQLQLVEGELSFCRLAKILKIHLFVQFYVLFISLLLWPGIPCGVTKTRWFRDTGKDWWCSPFVIITFNSGDLIASIIIIFFRHSTDNYLLLGLITLMGMSNGLLATVTFMVRPSSIVGVNNCERAAYLMTAAGSIVSAALALAKVL
ncbi:hypothetical protein I4U23_003295 [Adineta vaga]|nr:hypothetical protein I4U23_003295 [Adineta vaga]